MGRTTSLLAATVVLLVPSACSDDKNAADTTDAADTVPATTIAATTIPATTAEPNGGPLDFNGDGRVVLGVATTGPSNGGGWSQTLTDAAKALSAENGFADPIVVDNVHPDGAAALIGQLADQAVDVIILGAPAIAAVIDDIVAQHPGIYWYCNCGAGVAANPGLAQSTDSGAEIGYTAGYATGLLLDATGGRRATVIGCCDHGFEKEMWHAFEAGLQAADRDFRMTFVRTGESEYDFDNSANATAAFRTAVDERTHAVFPYLDGAHRAVVQAANDAGVIALSAGSSSACGDSDLAYDIAVRFDAGDYLRAVLPAIIDGTLAEGSTRAFRVGVDPEPGAVICNPTADQQAAMDALYARIASGELNDILAKITKNAFADEATT